jgi:hypothetical protein
LEDEGEGENMWGLVEGGNRFCWKVGIVDMGKRQKRWVGEERLMEVGLRDGGEKEGIVWVRTRELLRWEWEKL